MYSVLAGIALPIGLFLIMFGMGLSLVIADFQRVMAVKKPVFVGCFSMLILLPGLGFAVAHLFELSPALSVGLILVATCPGGMFSNLMTDYGKGHLALSITLTAIISCVYIFTIPGWTSLSVGAFMGKTPAVIGLPFLQTFVPLCLFVLLPILLGMVVRHRIEAWALMHAAKVKNIAAIIVIAIMVYIATVQEAETVENLPRIVAAVLTLNILSVVIAVIVGRLFSLERQDRLALIMEHAVRLEGTAIYIAATLLGNVEMALPLMLNSLVGLCIAGLFILMFRRRGAARRSRVSP